MPRDEFPPDPVQIRLAVELRKAEATIQQLVGQLELAGQVLGQTRLQLRLNEVVLARLLQEKFPQETAETPNLTVPMDDIKRDLQDSNGVGVQFVDDHEVDGAKHFAIYTVTTPEQAVASGKRAKALNEARAQQAHPLQAPPSRLILPGRAG